MRVTGAATVDERGLIGSTGARASAETLGRLRWREVFTSAPFPTFRRLDRLSKLACLVAEAAGVGDLPLEVRRETAQVLGSSWGCLDADVGFQESLQAGHDIKPALFPYTLPSTCLGELAVRHQLQGPTLCLSEAPLRLAAEEAVAFLEGEEARAVLLCLGDSLSRPAALLTGDEQARSFLAAIIEPGQGPALCSTHDLARAPSLHAFLADLLWQDASE